MKSQLLLIIAVLMTFLCAGEASALRLKVSEQNIQFFLQYESDRRYVCYRNTIEQVGPILGQIKDITLTPGARVKVIKDKRLSRSISKLERKIGGLSKKISKIKSLNPAPARLAKKLLRFEERLKKFSDQHSLLTGIFSWCLGANGEGGTPTPLPTITPTPTLDGSDPTPTPTPTITQPPGELEDFAGDPQSLAPYRDQLTEFEMRSVMNKLAFGGSERVIAAGLAGGRAAFVEALINDNPDLAEQNIPSEIPKPNSFYQIGDAEYWIYDHMQRGNGLQQFIALQLRDIFSVNLINNNNSESHNKAIPWYTMLYHDNALNFALQHEEAPSASKPCFNTGLPGSFEHLLCMQNWDLGMLRFLGNYSNNRFQYNENFGRELLELFTLKTHDIYSHLPNYTEADMENSTRANTGYVLNYNHPDGHARGDFSSYFFDNGTKVLWPGKPWEIRGNLNYQSLVEHILYNVPAMRNTAAELFARFVHPHPSEELTNELHQYLKDNGYHIGKMVRLLLNSQAMYSKAAYKPCVAEPVVSLFRLLRMTGIFIQNRDIKWRVHELLDHTNNIPLLPTDIFGMQLCGAIRGGEILEGDRAAIFSNMHFHMRDLQRVFQKIMNDMPNFDFLTVLPTPSISREDFVAHLEKIFALRLEAQQRQIILNYMYDGDSGNIDPVKVRGTLVLFYMLPEFHLR